MLQSMVELQSLCSRVTSGGTPLRAIPEYFDGGTIPWIKTGEVKQGFIHGAAEHITELGLENSSAKLIPANSLIVAMYGDGDTAGNVAVNRIPVTTNQACCNFVVDEEKAHYLFLYYYLKANYQNLVNLKLGGSQQNLNAATLKRFPVPAIEPAVQRKIAALLYAYDDLIANNQRRIALLESMAEEIYREWFVRMRFPGYDQEKFHAGRPVLWQPRKLGQVLQLRYGKALPEGQRVQGPYRVYGSAGVVGTHSEALVAKPSIVVGRKGNVGSIFWVSKPFYPIDTVYYVESELPLIYLRFLLSSMNFINSDAAVPGLNREQAYANEVLLPRDSLLSRFEEVVAPLCQQAALLEDQVESLRATRDALLPRLISGKLRLDHLDIQFPPSMQQPPEEAAQATAVVL